MVTPNKQGGECSMKFTVQYIPLSKIEPDYSLKITEHMKRLQRVMWDCMNIMVVKKNSKDGSYTVVSGFDRLNYLTKYTGKKYAPCLVGDDNTGFKSWILRYKQPLDDFPLPPKSWSIVREFLKREPRFKNLSRSQQIRVLLLGLRYKKTVIATMKNSVNQIVGNKD